MARSRIQEWNAHRRKLKKAFEEDGVTTCEARFPGCKVDNFLGFAHRHKRAWYYPRDREPLLGSRDHVLLLCVKCHDKIEDDRDLTEKTFNRLRP